VKFMDRRIIGITGGVGSGKSLIINYISEKYNYIILETDKIAKELMNPGEKAYEKIIDYFGLEILDSDLNINRKAFAEIIFNDKSKLEKVNSIVHPIVKEYIIDIISNIDNVNKCYIIESAILEEAKLTDLCDEIWFIDSLEDVRIKRLEEGRGYSYEKSKEIIKNQKSKEDFLAISDIVIDNSGDIFKTYEQIDRIFAE